MQILQSYSRRIAQWIAAAVLVTGTGLIEFGAVETYLDGKITNFDKDTPSRALTPQDGIAPQTGFFKTQDGLALRYARFVASQPARDTIVLLPGKSGTIENFQALANQYVKRDYQVFVMDPRSQGLSGRKVVNTQKVHVASFDEYKHDIAQFIREVVKPQQQGRLTIVAHSMSGGVVPLGLKDDLYPVDHVVLLAPMLSARELPRQGTLAIVAKSLSVASALTMNGTSYFIQNGDRDFAPHTASDNPYTTYATGYQSWVESWKKEPRLVTGGVTGGWINAYYQAGYELNAIRDTSIKTPMHVILAEDDTIIFNDEAKAFCERTAETCSIQIIPGQKHDLELAAKPILENIVDITTQALAKSPAPPSRITLAPREAAPTAR